MIPCFIRDADVSLIQSARSTIERNLREGKYVEAPMGDGDILCAYASDGKFVDIGYIKYIKVFYGESLQEGSCMAMHTEYFAPTDFAGAAKAMIARMSSDSHNATGLGLSLEQIAKLQG